MSEVIDPVDVRVGDQVEVEAVDGDWLVRGLVNARDTGQLQLVIGNTRFVWVLVAGANVNVVIRLVRRAEPEPDPEQVEALADLLDAVKSGLSREPRIEVARELVRRGVTVGGQP